MTVLAPDLVFASSGGEEGGFRRLPWRLSWLQQFLCHESQASDVDCSKIMSLDQPKQEEQGGHSLHQGLRCLIAGSLAPSSWGGDTCLTGLTVCFLITTILLTYRLVDVLHGQDHYSINKFKG
jgi:hypothetical protein